MKKVKILNKLCCITSGLSYARIPDDIRNEIDILIRKLKKDVNEKNNQTKYLKPLEAINMLVIGCVNRITNNIAYYYEIDKNNIICCYNNSDDSFITNSLCIDLDDKWWVLK